jgi:hypothetical protein
MAFLHIFFPGAYISAAVYVSICSMAVSLVIPELPIVDISFSMPESPTSFSFILYPLTLVLRSVRPDLDPVPMAFFTLHLSFVDRSVWIVVLIDILEARFLTQFLP